MAAAGPMVIATAPYPPASYPCSLLSMDSGPLCKLPGMHSEVIYYALKLANISFVTKTFPNPIWGIYSNGSWTGLLGMVRNGSIDTVNAGFAQVEIRNRDFDFSYPTSMVSYSFIVKNDVQSLSTTSAIVYQVFSPRFWFAVLFVVICLFTGLFMLERFSNTPSGTEGTWMLFCLLINQFNGKGGRSYPSKHILLLSGCLITTIVLPLYQNGLLTQLILPRTSIPFDSAEQLVDLVAQGRYRFIVLDAANSFIQTLTFQNSTFAHAFRNAISKNPVIVNTNTTQVMEMVNSGGHIFPTIRFRSTYLMSKYCDLLAVNVPGFGSTGRAYVFRKNSPFLAGIDEALRQSTEYVEFLNLKYNAVFSSGRYSQKSSYTSLGFFALLGAFFLITTGAGLSILYLGIEVLYYKKLHEDLLIMSFECARHNLRENRVLEAPQKTNFVN